MKRIYECRINGKIEVFNSLYDIIHAIKSAWLFSEPVSEFKSYPRR